MPVMHVASRVHQSRPLTTSSIVAAFAQMEAPKMVPVEAVDAMSTFVQNANVIATNSDDFGGSFIPVAGLTLLGALILYLSPPLSDE